MKLHPVRSWRLPIFVVLAGLSLIPLLRADDAAKYLDPNVPIEDRITDLLSKMTVEEKINQISDDWGSKSIPRLKIPALLKGEGLHAQSYSLGATIFPHSIAMAATFNTDLASQEGVEIAQESLADHIHSSWSPVLDCARDVRWGRVEETYGESPWLCSRMGVAWISAFQSQNMIAVPKHFAAHGEGKGGRDSNDVGLSERTIREIHLPSFRAAVEEAHAGGVMAAYSTFWDDVPDNASKVLLQQVLRQEWGFDGYVVSDCGGPEHFIQKHGIVATPAEACALAAAAGVNMECGSMYKTGMADAVEQGLVTPQELDDVVRPVLRAKFRLGLFEKPEPDKMSFSSLPQYDSAAARALAREIEVQAAVLLKNDKAILPLKKDIKTIAVIGPDADTPQTGDYSPKFRPDQLISVLAGIKSHVSATTQVVYAPGLDSPLSTDTSKFADAVSAAKSADVAVVVIGDNNREGGGNATTGENNDGATLDFPGAQRELLHEIQQTGTPTVLVIVNGKPFTLGWEVANVPAILVTWYPGEEGGDATADLLFGDRDPSGKLPITWPRSPAQLPLNYDYHPSGRKYDYYDMPFEPQFWFGYGLSYTQFQYSNLRITPKADDPGYVKVDVDISNVGDYDGDEVAQLYITDVISSVSTPVVELQGFQRVSLKKGETKTVTFNLTPYQLSLLDANMVRRVEPGAFRIHVGGRCPDVEKPNVHDDRKNRVGYFDSHVGIDGQFTEPKEYAAQFVYTLDTPAQVGGGQPFPATLTVKNDGNLTDVTEAKLFAGFQLDSWGFEIKPGESKTHVFQPAMYKTGDLAVVAGMQMVDKMINVEKAAARLDFKNIHFNVDANDVLEATADVQNVGGDPYSGELALKIDGAPAGDKQTVMLQPGEKRHVTLGYTFGVSGVHKVQLGDQPEQQIDVAGGIGLAVQNPLIYLKYEEGQGTTTKNEITGKNFNFKGTPTWVEGKNGKGLQFTDAGMSVDAEHLDIYRKPFTLSTWVKIDSYGKNGEIALFGGVAPMGADQDTSGTQLHAGLHDKKPALDFFGRDIGGSKEVPLGTWVNLTYVYDTSIQKGSMFINGQLDKQYAQKPYAGPLETIGDAPAMNHGNFTMDETVVILGALTPSQIRQLSEKGLESLRDGSYTSDWRSMTAAPTSLDVAADIPDGATIKVTIETGDASGKSTGSTSVDLKAGQTSYPLSGLTADTQVRLKVNLATTTWGTAPVLRAATITGGGKQSWSTPSDWSKGVLPNSLIGNFAQ
jgi:beta-glucosidase